MAPPLTPEQLRALVDLSKRARKVRRAAAVARFGGWTGALFAVVTLAGAMLSYSAPAVFVGVGLGVVAFGEFYGARLMAGLDQRGPKRLAMNQGLLGVVL